MNKVKKMSMQETTGKKRYFLAAEDILHYLIQEDGKFDTPIICKQGHIELYTTDLALHEAFGSIKPYDQLKPAKVAKFFENVDVQSYRQTENKEKPVLTHARVDEIRSSALKTNYENYEKNKDSKENKNIRETPENQENKENKN